LGDGFMTPTKRQLALTLSDKKIFLKNKQIFYVMAL